MIGGHGLSCSGSSVVANIKTELVKRLIDRDSESISSSVFEVNRLLHT